MTLGPLRLAIAQSAVAANVRVNGRHMRSLMDQAAAAGARLVQFPEAALSGYVKSQVKAWEDVDSAVQDEIEATARHSARLGIWTVAGCNHRLAAPKRPQNEARAYIPCAHTGSKSNAPSAIQTAMVIIIRFSVSEMKPSGTLLDPPTQAHFSSRLSM